MSKPTGGPAFPVKANHEGVGQYDSNGVTVQHTGLTLRDYFAGKALQGLASHPKGAAIHSGETPPAANARVAYAYADAMLAERNKGE